MLPASKMMEKYSEPALAAMLVLWPSACSVIDTVDPLLPPKMLALGISRAMRSTSTSCISGRWSGWILDGMDMYTTGVWHALSQGCSAPQSPSRRAGTRMCGCMAIW